MIVRNMNQNDNTKYMVHEMFRYLDPLHSNFAGLNP